MKKIILILLILNFKVFALNVVGSGTKESANTVLAGPTSGGAAQPSFRSLVAADIGAGIITNSAIAASTIDLTAKVTGILPIANGGSNGNTNTTGFDNLSPLTTLGDLIGWNGTHNVRLAVGTNNQVLVADNTASTGWKWAAAGSGAAFSTLTGGTNAAAAMIVGTGASLTTSGSGTITANSYNGSANINAATALTGLLPLSEGGVHADLSATGGAHNVLFQTSVGGNVSVAALVEADLPATTAFTDVANTFTTVQTHANYISLQSSSPAQLTASTTTFDPGSASYVRASSNATWAIQGMINGVNGRVVDIYNVGSSNITLSNNNAGATASNRIQTPTNADMTLNPFYGAHIIYDSTDSLWKVIEIFQAPGSSVLFSTIGSGTNTTAAMVVGNSSTLTTSGSGTITATAVPASGITGTLGVTSGGTGIAVGTSGAIPYFSGTTTIASSGIMSQYQLMIGGGSGATPYTLGSLGTTTTLLHGNASGNPSYATVTLTSDVGGILPIANGGTASNTSLTNNQLMVSSGSKIVELGAMTDGQLVVGKTSNLPQVVSAGGDVSSISNIGAFTFAASNTHITSLANLVTIGTIATGVWNGTTIAIANGGTGQTSASTAFNALAPATAKGGLIGGTGSNTYSNLAVGSNGQVLTADSTQTTGFKWASGVITGTSPILVTGTTVSLGTAIAPTTTDANADVGVGASATTTKPLILQTKLNNTADAFQIQNSVGTPQYQFTNATTSNADITETLSTFNTATLTIQSISENISIAASATTSSASNLLPVSSYIIGVTYRVTTAIPTASNFNLGDSVDASRFALSQVTTLGTTGTTLANTPALAPFINRVASTILVTPSSTPGAGTGTLRVTVFYIKLTAPGS